MSTHPPDHVRASIVIPAHNEAGPIGRLLAALLMGAPPGELDIVVVCNGCTDDTAATARRFGSDVRVEELSTASKRGAIIAGDAIAGDYPRIYVDADVEVGYRDIVRLTDALETQGVLAAAPTRVIPSEGSSRIVREYYRVWQRLPQVGSGLFGRGVIALSAEGHARITDLPPAMSDDLAISEAFSAAERTVVDDAVVIVRPPRTVRDLLRRRTRVHTGNSQFDRDTGRTTESKTSLTTLAGLVRRDPRLAGGVVVFVSIAVIARLRAQGRIRRGDFSTWLRDESSREAQSSQNKEAFINTVVIGAANPWDGVRMADRQLAEQLARHAPVLYVEPPGSLASRLRDSRNGRSTSHVRVRHVASNVVVLSPEVLPGIARRPVAALNARLLAAQVRHTVKHLGGTVRAVVDAGILMPIMGKCGEQRRIYWAQDDFVGIAPLVGLDPRQLARGEAWMTHHADAIIAANPLVAESITKLGRKATLIPFGCDFEHFASAATVTPAPDVTLTRPMAVFMGHLGDRIDLDLLRATAARDIDLLLVGPKHGYSDPQILQDVLSRPNVQWVGAKDFEQLPAYLAHGVVGLLPYTHSRFNLGSFPLKTLEYLAAGLPVVATSLPAVAWLNTPHITVADNAEDFADEVVRLVSAGRDPDLEAARRRFASDHTWASRADAFAKVIG